MQTVDLHGNFFLQYPHHFGEGLDEISSGLSFRERILGLTNPYLVNACIDSALDIGIP